MVPTFGSQPSVDHLTSVQAFRGCTKAQLREVTRLTEHVKVGEGEILLREGEDTKELFLILSGTGEVAQNGKVVNALGPGEFFGELSALCWGPRTATITAVTDLELLVIGPRVLPTMESIPGFRDALLKGMANRLRTVDAELAAVRDDGVEASDEEAPR
jgi:CRP/FNR family cyclic AMP-dependent transcriptional regulator